MGMLSYDEWKEMKINEGMTEEEYEWFFVKADKDGDGTVFFEEYEQYIKDHKDEIQLVKKLKDPVFKKFYDLDQSYPKD